AAITPAMRHAWVEVYLDGIGWMMVEVTGSRSEVHSDVVNITVNNVSVKYGNAIPKITYRGFESYAAEGYRFEPVFSEVPYEYGKHSVSIVDYKIYDLYGEDVTENFEFSQRTGTVQIYRDVISVNNFAPDGSDTYEFVFDGIEHKINNVRCTTSGFERMGLKLVLVSTESLVSVGEEPIRYEIQLLDASGKDVTAEYKVIKEYAKMKIYPRPIEITIDDVSAPFSDSEIKASSYKLTGGSLADGHTISSIVFGGSQTEIGCSESWVSEITIKNRSGISVEHNYSISYIPGELRITP
ncbi:MAG: transglutaminase family protein, partial [Clostridia bacterium]|nr:transglutaminase family protein [Clostridia bacterium]